ncbi:MAG: DUF4180 domain-containing protein [Devosia sp.]
MVTYTLPAAGPLIATEDDGRDLIGEAFGHGAELGAELVVIPAARLAPEFFQLSSGLAGAILQKFTNYQLRIAIVGDISAYTENSAPLRDFVRESNRHGDIRFLASEAEL